MSHPKIFAASTAPVVEAGTFSWTLECYKKLQLNETLQSPEFVVGGHMWFLQVTISDLEGEKYFNPSLQHPATCPPVFATYEFSLHNITGSLRQKKSPLREFKICTGGHAEGWGFPKFMLMKEIEQSPSESIILKCRIEVAMGHETHLESDVVEVQRTYSLPPCTLNTDLGCLLPDGSAAGLFYDFHFIIENEKIPVHKAILAARSPVFKTMFTTTMLEGKAESIILNDVDSELFTEMLRFIYTGTCNTTTLHERTYDLFAAADKYDLKRLKGLCEETLLQKVDLCNVFSILLLADMFHSAELRKCCIDFISGNFKEMCVTDGFKILIKENPSLVVDIHHTYAQLCHNPSASKNVKAEDQKTNKKRKAQ